MHICQDVFLYTRAVYAYTTHIKTKISTGGINHYGFKAIRSLWLKLWAPKPWPLWKNKYLTAEKKHLCRDVFLFTRVLITHLIYRKKKILTQEYQPLWLEDHPITVIECTSAESLTAFDKLSNLQLKTKCTSVKTFFFSLAHSTHTPRTWKERFSFGEINHYG